MIWLHVLHRYVHVLPSPSHFSATRMWVFHMYVSSYHSVRLGGGWGGKTPIHVHISLLETEHLRPEVRKKELLCFWEEVIDES